MSKDMQAIISELQDVMRGRTTGLKDDEVNKLNKNSNNYSKPDNNDKENLTWYSNELEDDIHNSILKDKKIALSIKENPEMTKYIEDEINSKLQSFGKKISKHPFQDEEKQLRQAKMMTIDEFIEASIQNELLKNLSIIYGNERVNYQFFEKKIKAELRESKEIDTKKINTIKDLIINRWNTLLQQKIDSWYMERIDELREELREILQDKIEKYQKMKKKLGSRSKDPDLLWDLSTGKWKKLDFNVLDHYDELIEQEPELYEIAEILGRRKEQTREKINNNSKLSKDNSSISGKLGTEELVGIHESSDINNLLPSELGMLGEKTMETLFYLKLVEKRLLTFDFTGSMGKIVTSDIKKQQIPRLKKGPIILCIDTSGSMKGVPERIAKTLTYAIVKIAAQENRKCLIIAFSISIQIFEVSNLNKDLQSLIEFLSFSFDGGTSFNSPVNEALRVVSDDKVYKNADILIISDFVIGSLDNSTIQKIKELKRKNLKLHSLIISSKPNNRVLKVFSNNWYYKVGSDNPLKNMSNK